MEVVKKDRDEIDTAWVNLEDLFGRPVCGIIPRIGFGGEDNLVGDAVVMLAATMCLRKSFDIKVEVDEVVQDDGAGVALEEGTPLRG